MEVEGMQISPKKNNVCAGSYLLIGHVASTPGNLYRGKGLGDKATFKSCDVNNIETFLILYRFENCWPAFRKDTTGVLMVFNPDVPQHTKELEKW